MRFACFLLSLLACTGISNVDAHAKLVSPAAWNANPSKSQICGVPANSADPSKYTISIVDPTKLMAVRWAVVIGDGVGPLSAAIETTAKTNPVLGDFKVKLEAVGPNNPSSTAANVNPYTIMFQIPPNTVCTGPGGTCTIRFTSTSNWVACATIKLQAANPAATLPPRPPTQAPTLPPTAAPTRPPTPPATRAPTDEPTEEPEPEPEQPEIPVATTAPPATTAPLSPTQPAGNGNTNSNPTQDPYLASLGQDFIDGLLGFKKDPASPSFSTLATSDNKCVMVTGLTTCKALNGRSVQVLGFDANTVDAQAKEDIEAAMKHENLLTTVTEACRQAYIDFTCAQVFPACYTSGVQVCRSSCERVNTLCKPNTQPIETDGVITRHAMLYDCSNPQLGFDKTSDSLGTCPNVVTGVRPATANGAQTVTSATSIFMAVAAAAAAMWARV